MNKPYKYTFIATLLLASTHVCAQSAEDSSAQATGEQAAAAEAASDAGSEKYDSSSEIRVRQAGTTTVREFHQQGKVYKVEVAPKNTPAYILSDQDGDGNLNSSDTGIENDLVVPEWTIGNW